MDGESVPPERAQRLAALARVELSAGEMVRVVAEHAALRRALDLLPGADESGGREVEEEDRRAAPLRPDRVGFDPLLIPPGEVAPAWRDGFFVVPRLPAGE